MLLASGAGHSQAQPAPAAACDLAGYNANITTAPSLARVKPRQLVEFNPNSRDQPSDYLRRVAARGALPEWYWVGVNCDKGPDCDRLRAAGVGLVSTGTAEWNKTEARIADLRHPAAIARMRREFRRALTAAGEARTNLAFRIDNMHNLDTPRFYDHIHIRTYEEVRVLTDTWAKVVAEVRAEGRLPPSSVVGLTAHNNFKFWRRHLDSGGTPPLLLRLENPTQFEAELAVGLDIMKRYRIPLVAVEFRRGHGYTPSAEKLKAIAGAVSYLIVMENEDNYEDGQLTAGPGPKRMAALAADGKSCAGERQGWRRWVPRMPRW
jgi:hypothetical protein